MSEVVIRPRHSAVGVLCLALFMALIARLAYLQLGQEHIAEVAVRDVHTRIVHTEGPRGRILDRKGRVLVDNRISIVVNLDNKQLQDLKGEDASNPAILKRMDTRRKLFNRLAIALGEYGYKIQGSKIEALFNDKKYGPQDLIPIVEDVPEQLEHYLLERSDEYPGVVVQRRSLRTYPYGAVASQILGYVGQINDAELAQKQKDIGRPGQVDADQKPYEERDEIGKAGIERSMEQYLRGVPGDQEIEVSAQGKFIRALSQPQLRPGEDVWLSIDIDQQAYAERQLTKRIYARNYNVSCDGDVRCDAKEGAIAAVDPKDGTVIALASYPGYDPRQLVGGLSADVWDRLNDPDNHTPMLNRAISGVYSPGSTFKPFTGYAALEGGLINANSYFTDSRGFWEIDGCSGEKCRFYNDTRRPGGTVNLAEALTVSNDVFYYRIGDDLWRARDRYGDAAIQDAAKKFGLGVKLNVELPGESSALVGDPAWLANQNPNLFDHVDWKVGDSINASIGQGLVSVTPLQLATAYAAIANGGTVYRPQIVLKVTRPIDLSRPVTEEVNNEIIREMVPEVISVAKFTDPAAYRMTYEGLLGVVMSGSGTAVGPYRAVGPGFSIAGKTGTIQVGDDPKTGAARPPTSAFVGFGPATRNPEDLEMAVAAFLPAAGYGADAAAPLVFEVMKAFHKGTSPELDAAPNPGVSVSTTTTSTTTTTTLPVPTTTTTSGSSGARNGTTTTAKGRA